MPTVKPKEPPSFHPAHDDPSDDLVFISTDGTLFRASSHKLARNSEVFKSMKATADNTSITPLDLDVKADIAHAFLTAISSPYAPILSSTIEDVLILLALVDKWACSGIEERVMKKVEEIVPKDPWRALQLASGYDRVDIGRLAISHFTIGWIAQLDWRKLSSLQASWHWELMRCLYSHASMGDAGHHHYGRPSAPPELARGQGEYKEENAYGRNTFTASWTASCNSRYLGQIFNPAKTSDSTGKSSKKRKTGGK